MQTILLNALHASNTGAGISRYTFELATNLAKLTDQVHFVIPRSLENYFPPEQCTRYFHHAPGTAIRILFDQVVLPGRLRNFSLVHYPDLAKPLLCRQPVILTLHDLCHLREPYLFTLTQRFWRTVIGNYSLRRAAGIICVSQFTKHEAGTLLHIPEDKLRVVHSGIRAIVNPRVNCYLPPSHKPYILFVGTIIPRKNIIRLIKAFSELKKHLNYKLIIIGGGGRSEAYTKKIRQLDLTDVVFTGYLPDSKLAEFYSQAAAFVFPSLYEGFGFPALEAMAHGIPCVVANAAALPEICGDAAYYVDPLNTAELTAGMYKVLTNSRLRESLIHKGFDRIKLFSWENTAQQTLKVYHDILNS